MLMLSSCYVSKQQVESLQHWGSINVLLLCHTTFVFFYIVYMLLLHELDEPLASAR